MGGHMGAGEDEELPQPHRVLSGSRGRWLWRTLAAGAVLAAATVVIVNAVGDGHDGPSSPSTSPTPLGLHVATDFVTLRPMPGGGYLPPAATRPPRCPGDTQCVTVHAVSESVRDAVSDAFPGAVLTSARTVHLHVENYGDALTGLDVKARRGNEQIIMRLRGVSSVGTSPVTRPPGSVILFNGYRITEYEAELAQYHVVVQVVAPADQRQDLAPLVQLASDGRLLHM